jgi:hypothetical protein
MATEVVFLVGDQYDHFATNDHVITQSRLLERIAYGPEVGGLRIVLGQGLGTGDDIDLQANTQGGIRLESLDSLATLALTHKRAQRHVLVTSPRRVGPQAYEMALAVDDVNDRLVDHVTGQHVSGMVLIEAARQASIATAELEYLIDAPEPCGFVWNGLRINFSRFAFPLPAGIRVKLRKDVANDRAQPRYVSEVEIHQAAQSVCEMEMTFGILRSSTFLALEAKAARRAIEAARSFYMRANEPGSTAEEVAPSIGTGTEA